VVVAVRLPDDDLLPVTVPVTVPLPVDPEVLLVPVTVPVTDPLEETVVVEAELLLEEVEEEDEEVGTLVLLARKLSAKIRAGTLGHPAAKSGRTDPMTKLGA